MPFPLLMIAINNGEAVRSTCRRHRRHSRGLWLVASSISQLLLHGYIMYIICANKIYIILYEKYNFYLLSSANYKAPGT